jgi:hypothetical protein
MKAASIFRSFVICLFLLAFMPAASSSAGQAKSNLAPNPSFERGHRQLVKSWSPTDNSATFTWASGNAYSGKHSVCISNLITGGFQGWTTNKDIPVSQGTDYVFTAYAKGDYDGTAYLGFWAKDANGGMTEHSLFLMSFNNTTWTSTQITYRPAAGTVSVRLEIGAQDLVFGTTTPSICFDSVSFEAVP